jgi:hypothetical protein
MWPSPESQCSNMNRVRSQIPACRQSPERRQQVMPEPQPKCFGSIGQRMPLRSTKRIPVRQARSDTRGRPPCGFSMQAGRSGRIKLHSAYETSSAAIKIPPSRGPDARIVQAKVLLQALSLTSVPARARPVALQPGAARSCRRAFRRRPGTAWRAIGSVRWRG